MDVSELFRQLSYGEFSNLSLGVEGSGTIDEDQYPKIIIAANEGLLRLYSRFLLKEKDVLIEMVAHITNYHLLKKFAESSFDPTQQHYPYIKDLPAEPFEEDVIKILSVYNSFGNQMPLNDDEKGNSLFTPQANVLQVPRPVDRASLSVMYQARHPELSEDALDAVIELPDVLEGALKSFIAYKIYDNMNTQESAGKSQSHYSNFQNICDEAVDRDLVASSVSLTNSRFDQRGWE